MIMEALSDAKNRASAPMDSQLTNSLMACLSSLTFCFSVSGVLTHPGHIAFAVIPILAPSSASTFVKPIRPCLEAT